MPIPNEISFKSIPDAAMLASVVANWIDQPQHIGKHPRAVKAQDWKLQDKMGGHYNSLDPESLHLRYDNYEPLANPKKRYEMMLSGPDGKPVIKDFTKAQRAQAYGVLAHETNHYLNNLNKEPRTTEQYDPVKNNKDALYDESLDPKWLYKLPRRKLRGSYLNYSGDPRIGINANEEIQSHYVEDWATDMMSAILAERNQPQGSRPR